MKTFVLYLSLLSFATQLAAAAPKTKEPIDPCNKPEFCPSDTKVPDAENCTNYYECVTGSWMNRPCPTGIVFDSVTLVCTNPDLATCQPECPPFTGSTTERVTPPSPGTCEDIQQCVENQKYPDRSSCFTYYLCTGGQLVLLSCPSGLVFDIYVADCITPDSNFDCNYRCVTPSPL